MGALLAACAALTAAAYIAGLRLEMPSVFVRTHLPKVCSPESEFLCHLAYLLRMLLRRRLGSPPFGGGRSQRNAIAFQGASNEDSATASFEAVLGEGAANSLS